MVYEMCTSSYSKHVTRGFCIYSSSGQIGNFHYDPAELLMREESAATLDSFKSMLRQ